MAVLSTVSELLDSNEPRAAGYLGAALCCCHMGVRERLHSRSSVWMWPAFWFVTAGVLAAIAVGHALELDELVTEFGRSQARFAGWYRTRRGLQAALVGSVSAVWTVVVLVAIWRVPERRRRYLPTAVVVFTMVCFVAVRLVSLHHADTLFYRRSVAGVRIVAVVEWILLALAVLSSYWHPFVTHAPSAGSPRPLVAKSRR